MKLLKFICFFIAGAIVQTALYVLECLSMSLFSWVWVIFGTAVTVIGGIILGFTARSIAMNKLKMPPFSLVMSYVAGTIAVVVALFIITDINNPYVGANGSGLGNLTNLGRAIGLFVCFLTLLSAAVNAIVQIITGIRDKVIAKRMGIK